MLTFHWHEGTNIDGLRPITQVYGVCFDDVGRVLLLRQSGQGWNIPGGTPEPGETASETLIREVYEETTVHIGHHELIGYQSSIDKQGKPFYQLRYAALIDRIDPQLPDPDKGAIHTRLFVTPEKVMDYITYPQYAAMFEVATRWYARNQKHINT